MWLRENHSFHISGPVSFSVKGRCGGLISFSFIESLPALKFPVSKLSKTPVNNTAQKEDAMALFLSAFDSFSVTENLRYISLFFHFNRYNSEHISESFFAD